MARFAGIIADDMRFAAIGHVIIAIEIPIAAGTAAIGTIGIVTANVPGSAAIFAVTLKIDTFAIANIGVILGTSGNAFACQAGLTGIAPGRTITAVFGIGLNIDAFTIAPFLAIFADFLVCNAVVVLASFLNDMAVFTGKRQSAVFCAVAE